MSPMRPRPDLSIVIPAFNEQDRLALTLRDYLAYCSASGRAVEVIVVDDGSLDATSTGPDQGATFIIRLPIPPHKAGAQDLEHE